VIYAESCADFARPKTLPFVMAGGPAADPPPPPPVGLGRPPNFAFPGTPPPKEAARMPPASDDPAKAPPPKAAPHPIGAPAPAAPTAAAPSPAEPPLAEPPRANAPHAELPYADSWRRGAEEGRMMSYPYACRETRGGHHPGWKVHVGDLPLREGQTPHAEFTEACCRCTRAMPAIVNVFTYISIYTYIYIYTHALCSWLSFCFVVRLQVCAQTRMQMPYFAPRRWGGGGGARGPLPPLVLIQHNSLGELDVQAPQRHDCSGETRPRTLLQPGVRCGHLQDAARGDASGPAQTDI
jgi:hypothetical protein